MPATAPRRVLLIGLGNPVLSDDGVGWRVVREAAAALGPESGVEVVYSSRGGLALMERMVGYDRVVIVDAVRTGAPAGTLHRLGPADLKARHTASSHDATLGAALELGRRLGAELPDDGAITILGVEADDVETFGETLTQPLRRALPAAARLLVEELAKERVS